VANGGTNASTASITSFNNITGYTASGATGTTSTNLVFSTSPAITTPSVTGDLTMSTGNVVMSNGKGIDFSATPGTGTSELLADYEEGTFTATLKGSVSDPTTPVTTTGRYTKIGNIVSFTIAFEDVNTSGASGAASIAGLPFSASGRSPCSASSYRTLAFANQYAANASATSVEFLNIVSGGDWTDATITAGGLRFLYVNGSYGV
jgi:hypothetical protein